MLGIIIALYDEAYLLTHKLQFQKINGVYQYNGTIDNYSVSLFLCKPKVKKKSQLKKWLTQHPFKRIINIGYAGALQKNLKWGEVYSIYESIYIKEEKLCKHKVDSISLNYATSKIVSSNHILYTLKDKTDMYHKSQALLIDMESFILKQLFVENHYSYPLCIYKIIGDELKEENYLIKEEKMQNIFSKKKSLHVLVFLNWNSLKIFLRKKILQRKVLKVIQHVVKLQLMDHE